MRGAWPAKRQQGYPGNGNVVKQVNEERHDNEAEKDGGAGEGDEEYLEIQEPLDTSGSRPSRR